MLILIILVITTYSNQEIIRVMNLAFLSPIKDKTIVIDPGHGGIDGGACTKNCLEKDINLKVARILRDQLILQGAKVILTRDSDTDLSHLTAITRQKQDLNSRLSMIERNQPDLFLSIHVNTGRPKVSGSMVFYNKRSPSSQLLANALQYHLNILMEQNSLKRHLPKSADYYILRNTSYTGAIVELGFMTNSQEREKLIDSKYKVDLANSIVRGLKDYFSGKVSESIQLNDSKNSNIKTEQNVSNSSEKSQPKLFFPNKITGEIGYELLHSKESSTFQLSELKALYQTMDALLVGPQDNNLQSIFDPKTSILNLNIHNGIAIINFSKEFKKGLGSYDEYQAINCLVETATQFYSIRGLKILVEGKETDTLNGHIALNKIITPSKPKSRIAFVIDDLAGGEEGRKEIMAIDRPLTLAVLPEREMSKEIAEESFNKGYEVFLHIPMEPEKGSQHWLGKGAITVSLPRKKIRETLISDLKSVPHAVGINNHMGSKITKREDIMKEVLLLAKERHLLVLDSRTTDETVIPKLAKELNIKYVQRNVFLDNINSLSHVKKQINSLAKTAIEKGFAVGIGHVGEGKLTTARGIKEMIPWLEDQGIELVFVTNLFTDDY